jgi:ATP-dependent DNA helicase PIF1
VCQHLGLLQSDDEWDAVMLDAALLQMCSSMRDIFVWILEFNTVADPFAFFERHALSMADDFVRRHALPVNSPLITAFVLWDIEKRIVDRQKVLAKFGLPALDPVLRLQLELLSNLPPNPDPAVISRQIVDHLQERAKADSLTPGLLAEQKAVLDAVVTAVELKTPLAIFLDAPGGTGKTHTINTILAAVRGLAPRTVAIAMASSGIAATLLSLGATVHSTAKVSLTTCETTFGLQTPTAELFRIASVMVIDEAPMQIKDILEGLDRMLRALMGLPDVPFGGKVVLLSGDFRQILPVVKRGSRAQIVGSCIKKSYLWKYFKSMRLTINMRALLSTGLPGYVSAKVNGSVSRLTFPDFLMRLGNGELDTFTYEDKWKDAIAMPAEICMPPNSTVDVFPNLATNCLLPDWIPRRVVLCPKNVDVDDVNQRMFARWPGNVVFESLSADALEGDDAEAQSMTISTEYLNTLRVSGLPAHKLSLKPGMVQSKQYNLKKR